MPTRLSGTLYTLEENFLYVGPLVRSAPHAHHAGQIMWVPSGVRLQRGDETPQDATFAVIRPRAPHAHGDAPLAAVLWLDGDDARWKLADALDTEMPTALGEAEPLESVRSAAAAQALVQRLLRPFTPDGATRGDAARHPSVRRMCALLDAGATTPSRELSFAELARRSGLSARQLRDVFLRDTGLTPRAYLRWRRLRRAVARIRAGASLTTAAVDAGFADGAHFSRVFHAQFGIAPTRAFASIHFGGALSVA